MAVVNRYAAFRGSYHEGESTFTATDCYVADDATQSVQPCLATVEFGSPAAFCASTAKAVTALLTVRWGSVSVGVNVSGRVSAGQGTLTGVAVMPAPGVAGLFGGSVSIVDSCDGDRPTAEEFVGGMSFAEI